MWPKPLPSVTDADGLVRQWVTGQVGASCIDSHDHIVTVNRGFLPGGLLAQEGTQSIPAPPVTLYDPAGNIVESWGDATLTSAGAAAVLPHGIHGCFVDAQDNIWIAGNSDGVVQQWSHDGDASGDRHRVLPRCCPAVPVCSRPGKRPDLDRVAGEWCHCRGCGSGGAYGWRIHVSPYRRGRFHWQSVCG